MVLLVVCAFVVGAGAARLSAHTQPPRLEAPTTEPSMWIAATSSYYT